MSWALQRCPHRGRHTGMHRVAVGATVGIYSGAISMECYKSATDRSGNLAKRKETQGNGLKQKTPEILGFSRGFRGLKVVVGGGLEPPSLSAYAPQAYVSANFTIRPVESAAILTPGFGERKGVNRFFSRGRISPSATRR